MKLEGTANDRSNDDRLSVMRDYHGVCISKVNHIDSLRQRNMSIALAIFAVLFGFGLRSFGMEPALFAALALVVLMLTFCLLDRRLHTMSHGWRDTGHGVLTALAKASNSPSEPVEFSRYIDKAEEKAEWWSLQPILYYLLVVCGGLSYFAFLAVGTNGNQ